MVNRKELNKIIHTKGGKNWWKPDLFKEYTLKLLPRELEIIENPPEYFKNYNCFIYVFGLSNDQEIIKDTKGFIYDTFVLKLLEEGLLKYVNNPNKGDYILYQDLDNYPHNIAHVGIILNQKEVISKWAWGPLVKHKILDVPASYGNNIKFISKIPTEEAKSLYFRYKEFNSKEVILDVPFFSQPKGLLHCAIACARMLMAFNGKEYTHEELIKHFLELDNTQIGISPASAHFMLKEGFSVIYFMHQSSLLTNTYLENKTEKDVELFKKHVVSLTEGSSERVQWEKIIQFIEAGGKFSTKLTTTDDIDKLLISGIPVRVGSKCSILYANPNNTGTHAVVVSGMNKNEYLINDPAPRFKEPYWINKKQLLEAWRANGSRVTAIVGKNETN